MRRYRDALGRTYYLDGRGRLVYRVPFWGAVWAWLRRTPRRWPLIGSAFIRTDERGRNIPGRFTRATPTGAVVEFVDGSVWHSDFVSWRSSTTCIRRPITAPRTCPECGNTGPFVEALAHDPRYYVEFNRFECECGYWWCER